MPSSVNLALRKQSGEGTEDAQITVSDLVIAGWTGRDDGAVRKHIEELESLGVPGPKSYPIFFRLAAALLTIDGEIQMPSAESSGEVEFVLFGRADGLWVGTGSDHTERQVETTSMVFSKQLCAKPVAPEIWPFSEVSDHWDELMMRSWTVDSGERRLYQEGPAAAMRTPQDLIARYSGGGETLPPGFAMFGGTFAVHGGLRPAERFEFELEDPVLGRKITHGYDIKVLPEQI